MDPSPNSYGAPFAAAGGGVWVTEFAETGVNIWFFSRNDVPASLATDSVDIASLGTPTAAYPSSSCNPSQYFKEQEIVIDITLCGDWAGVKTVLESTCPALNGTNTCYTTYVLDPKNYDTAYFEMASVKLFATTPSAVSLAPSSTQTSSTGSGGGSGGSGNSAAGLVDRSWSVYVGTIISLVASAAVGTAVLSF
ncbi:hypothetical protein FRC19_009894 [Serendipita sp. 401]|nr:hypothetical protein FRC19_009894 [Serendipita sp. 401]